LCVSTPISSTTAKMSQPILRRFRRRKRRGSRSSWGSRSRASQSERSLESVPELHPFVPDQPHPSAEANAAAAELTQQQHQNLASNGFITFFKKVSHLVKQPPTSITLFSSTELPEISEECEEDAQDDAIKRDDEQQEEREQQEEAREGTDETTTEASTCVKLEPGETVSDNPESKIMIKKEDDIPGEKNETTASEKSPLSSWFKLDWDNVSISSFTDKKTSNEKEAEVLDEVDAEETDKSVKRSVPGEGQEQPIPPKGDRADNEKTRKEAMSTEELNISSSMSVSTMRTGHRRTKSRRFHSGGSSVVSFRRRRRRRKEEVTIGALKLDGNSSSDQSHKITGTRRKVKSTTAAVESDDQQSVLRKKFISGAASVSAVSTWRRRHKSRSGFGSSTSETEDDMHSSSRKGMPIGSIKFFSGSSSVSAIPRRRRKEHIRNELAVVLPTDVVHKTTEPADKKEEPTLDVGGDIVAVLPWPRSPVDVPPGAQEDGITSEVTRKDEEGKESDEIITYKTEESQKVSRVSSASVGGFGKRHRRTASRFFTSGSSVGASRRRKKNPASSEQRAIDSVEALATAHNIEQKNPEVSDSIFTSAQKSETVEDSSTNEGESGVACNIDNPEDDIMETKSSKDDSEVDSEASSKNSVCTSLISSNSDTREDVFAQQALDELKEVRSETKTSYDGPTVEEEKSNVDVEEVGSKESKDPTRAENIGDSGSQAGKSLSDASLSIDASEVSSVAEQSITSIKSWMKEIIAGHPKEATSIDDAGPRDLISTTKDISIAAASDASAKVSGPSLLDEEEKEYYDCRSEQSVANTLSNGNISNLQEDIKREVKNISRSRSKPETSIPNSNTRLVRSSRSHDIVSTPKKTRRESASENRPERKFDREIIENIANSNADGEDDLCREERGRSKASEKHDSRNSRRRSLTPPRREQSRYEMKEEIPRNAPSKRSISPDDRFRASIRKRRMLWLKQTLRHMENRLKEEGRSFSSSSSDESEPRHRYSSKSKRRTDESRSSHRMVRSHSESRRTIPKPPSRSQLHSKRHQSISRLERQRKPLERSRSEARSYSSPRSRSSKVTRLPRSRSAAKRQFSQWRAVPLSPKKNDDGSRSSTSESTLSHDDIPPTSRPTTSSGRLTELPRSKSERKNKKYRWEKSASSSSRNRKDNDMTKSPDITEVKSDSGFQLPRLEPRYSRESSSPATITADDTGTFRSDDSGPTYGGMTYDTDPNFEESLFDWWLRKSWKLCGSVTGIHV